MVGKDSKAWEYCWHVDSVGDKLEEEVDAKFCNELFSERKSHDSMLPLASLAIPWVVSKTL
jgi:hypothetical protein